MATTLATIYERFLAGAGEEAEQRPAAIQRFHLHGLRPLPNEDVHFWAKRLDNTRVVRQPDPEAQGTCWRLIGAACLVAILLVGLLFPSAYSLLAGYQIQKLRQEHQRLLTEKASLELAEARLLSPERLEALAHTRSFSAPTPDRVLQLNPPADGSLAMNVAGK